ncbi:MAG: LON peptidase substrate-binding domain-containing protein, partial [Pseudomonadota bacterium]
FGDLPASLPVFPLRNAVVLPGGYLPLNIFEPRYLNMVRDAMRSHQLIGMIQPKPDQSALDSEPELYRVGCAGRIFRYQETQDGRLEIALIGLCRFSVAEEMASTRAYRIIAPSWDNYKSDFEKPEQIGTELESQFKASLQSYMRDNKLETQWSSLQKLHIGDLCNSILSFLPLEAEDKQMLVESDNLTNRLKIFSAILENGSQREHQPAH